LSFKIYTRRSTNDVFDDCWTQEYKYLGYWISTKLGWSKLITRTVNNIRQRTTLINSYKFAGASSPKFCRVLFTAFVLPLFTWLMALYSLFTLGRFYILCVISGTVNRLSCYTNYWRKYLRALHESNDGRLLLEQEAVISYRTNWLEFESKIVGLRRSRRFVQYPDVLSKCLSWYEENMYTTNSGRWWQITYTCEGKRQQPK
jgi:hypothetical protein